MRASNVCIQGGFAANISFRESSSPPSSSILFRVAPEIHATHASGTQMDQRLFLFVGLLPDPWVACPIPPYQRFAVLKLSRPLCFASLYSWRTSTIQWTCTAMRTTTHDVEDKCRSRSDSSEHCLPTSDGHPASLCFRARYPLVQCVLSVELDCPLHYLRTRLNQQLANYEPHSSLPWEDINGLCINSLGYQLTVHFTSTWLGWEWKFCVCVLFSLSISTPDHLVTCAAAHSHPHKWTVTNHSPHLLTGRRVANTEKSSPACA